MTQRTNSSTNISLRLRAKDLDAVADAFNVRPNGDKVRIPCPEHKGDDQNVSVWVDDEDFLAFDCKSDHGCKSTAVHDRVREAVLAGGYRGNGTPPESKPPVPLPTEEELALWVQIMRHADDDPYPTPLVRQLSLAGWQGHSEALADLGVGHDGERIIFPIRNAAGELIGTQRYAPGSKLKSYCPGGQHRGLFPAPESIQSLESIFAFEGEPDAVTARLAGLPATGVPGMTGWSSEWIERFRDFERVFVCFDCKDNARAAADKIVAELVAAGISAVRIDLDPDRQDGFDFKDLVRERGFTEAAEHVRELSEAANPCATVAPTVAPDFSTDPALLAKFEGVLHRCALTGENENAKLLYLCLTSRLLQRPLAMAVKGLSSGGKSYTVETVLRAFPPEAFYALSAMSEKSLIYSTEPVEHRTLVLYEATGMSGEWASYLIRSLLSEGRIRYETTEQVKGQIRGRLIEREGPTGLIVTTTATSLHAENETRMLTLTINDTREQTAAVMKVQALAAVGCDDPRESAKLDELAEWHQLQRWLAESGPHDVVIPFAVELHEKIPPVAVRLRRDFPSLLGLIMAHALLHRATRDTDDEGRIIATVDEDYAVVRELVASVLSENLQATVSPQIRETVEAVRSIHEDTNRSANLSQLAASLDLDKATVSRRAKAALEAGYLANLEDRLGRPARYITDTELPEDVDLLTLPEDLQRSNPFLS